MDYLSLCLIARDEGAYLREWVDYHILLGVERFFIYDNESAVPIRETLKEYVQAGWVVVTEIAGQGQQLFAYDHCLQAFGQSSRWIGFIDTDEFLVPRTCTSLPDFLAKYEEYAGLAVSSLFFGTSGHRKKPAGGQLASYSMRTPSAYRSNRLVKSIMQPTMTLWPISPHLFVCKDEHFIVNEDFQRVDSQLFPHHNEKIQLNHYFTRSFEEVEEKLKRGRGDAGLSYENSRFDTINQAATEKDTRALDLLRNLLPADSLARSGPNTPILLEAIHNAALEKLPANPPMAPAPAETHRKSFVTYLEKVDQATGLIMQRDWESALHLKAQVIDMVPGCIAHITDFASVCLQKGNYPLAWQAIAQAWKIAPQTQLVLSTLAEYCVRIKDFSWLEKVGQMLISLNPQENTSYYPLAVSLLNQGQIDKGLELALSILPDLLDGIPSEHGRAYLLIKTITPHLFARHEVEMVNRLVRVAIILNPKDISLFTTLIQMNLDLKDIHAAREIIAQALEHHPDNPEILALQEIVRNLDLQQPPHH